MKNSIKALTTVSVFALATSVQASVSESDGLGTSWIGTPTFTSGGPPTTFTTSEGNFGGSNGANGFGALSQSFELSTSGTLQNIQLVLAGSVQTFNVELYNLGPYPATGYPATSASYTPSLQPDLLVAGDQFTYNGGAAGAQSVAELTFSGVDANITLNAGELYALQIDPTATPDSFWARDGVETVNGQAYRMNQFSSGNMGAINGSIRDFGLAVTVEPVPEPASMALLALGGVFGTFIVRRRK